MWQSTRSKRDVMAKALRVPAFTCLNIFFFASSKRDSVNSRVDCVTWLDLDSGNSVVCDASLQALLGDLLCTFTSSFPSLRPWVLH